MSMINWAVRKKMIVLQLVAYLNFFGGFGIWGMTGHQAWFLAGVAVVLAAAVGLGLIRCPRCHNFAYQLTTRFAGVSWTYWGGNPFPPHCAVCHLDFREPYHPSASPRARRES
jgi:hypothetical protein